MNTLIRPEEIKYDPTLDRSLKKLTVVKVERGGATYFVQLGMFKMHVVVLHMGYNTRNQPRVVLKRVLSVILFN